MNRRFERCATPFQEKKSTTKHPFSDTLNFLQKREHTHPPAHNPLLLVWAFCVQPSSFRINTPAKGEVRAVPEPSHTTGTLLVWMLCYIYMQLGHNFL